MDNFSLEVNEWTIIILLRQTPRHPHRKRLTEKLPVWQWCSLALNSVFFLFKAKALPPLIHLLLKCQLLNHLNYKILQWALGGLCFSFRKQLNAINRQQAVIAQHPPVASATWWNTNEERRRRRRRVTGNQVFWMQQGWHDWQNWYRTHRVEVAVCTESWRRRKKLTDDGCKLLFTRPLCMQNEEKMCFQVAGYPSQGLH